MITRNDIATLLDAQTREYISLHVHEEPSRLALSLRENGALIATQIKYLQRSRTKLPSYYHAQCIIPPLAFEQCSSEESAAVKRYAGDTCIDLTCGLGVDSFYLSKRFKRVISVERDPILSEITRMNFGWLGAENITVINAAAEDFLAQAEASCHSIPAPEHPNGRQHTEACANGVNYRESDAFRAGQSTKFGQIKETGKTEQAGKIGQTRDCGDSVQSEQIAPNGPFAATGQIDLIYIDPARRDDKGHKVWLLEDCSPDVIRLMPRLLALSPRVVVKASPLFDTEEAFRLFGKCAAVTVEVVSVRGECKEVLIELSRRQKHSDRQEPQTTNNNISGEMIRLTAAGRPSLCFDRTANTWLDNRSADNEANFGGRLSATGLSFDPAYLLIPDVALYKARLVESYATRSGCTATSATGYCFGTAIPENFFGKAYRIREAMPYQPKKLKQQFKASGIARCNILKKDFPQDADTIAKALGIRQGGTHYAAFTRIGENLYAFLLDAETPLPAEIPLHG